MKAAFAIDTNIAIYAFKNERKAERAILLLGNGPSISVQLLNEFANVARRKMGFSWAQVEASLAAIRSNVALVAPLTEAAHDEALRLAERYRLSIYDALVVAVALGSGCETLLSEDMQNGLVIDGQLKIVNPFVDA